jgi:hypothetical protein
MITEELLQRLNQFLRLATRLRTAHTQTHYPSLTPDPPLEMMNGQRYVRVVAGSRGSRSVYCFIDKTNGDVLKAEGWKKPAKHKRSNLFDDDYGLSGVGPYGAKYLK